MNNLLTLFSAGSRMVFAVKHDGSIEFGDGVTPEGAAKEFFERLRNQLQRPQSEREAELTKRIEVLESKLTAQGEAFDSAIKTLELCAAEREKSLAAATNDAARVELRARDVVELLVRCAKYASEDRAITPGFTRLGRLMEDVRHAFTALPDSDARLREVIRRALRMGGVVGEQHVDAVLRGES